MKHEAMYISEARVVLKSFIPYITNAKNKFALRESVNEYNKNFPRMRANIKSGASRSTIIFDNFVVKFDTGSHYYGDTLSEYRGYRLAIENGVDKFFAPIVKIKVENHYYYIMKKIAYLATEDENYEGWCWNDAVEEYYGEDEEDSLDWITSEFGDLHDENYGFTEDGEMLIIDYAWNRFRNPNRS